MSQTVRYCRVCRGDGVLSCGHYVIVCRRCSGYGMFTPPHDDDEFDIYGLRRLSNTIESPLARAQFIVWSVMQLRLLDPRDLCHSQIAVWTNRPNYYELQVRGNRVSSLATV